MDKKVFIKKIFEDVHLVIENYLNNGQFVSYNKWEELDGFVYEKFPFLSIAFLIKENLSENDYYEYIKRYKDSISLEVKTIKELFLTDMDEEIIKLKSDNDNLAKQRESQQNTINKLQYLYSDSEQHLRSSIKEIEALKKRITVLEKEKTVINVLTKEQIVAIWSNYYSLPYINDNAFFDRTNFDTERFIEDLTTRFSISITSEELLENNSLTKVIDLLQNKQSCYKEEFNKLLNQYPQQKETIKELNANNVTRIILSCCPKKNGTVPKYVFGTDTLEKAQLNVEKLYSILYYNFGLKESTLDSIRSVKNIDELKEKILSWQQKVTINSATLTISKIAKSIEEQTKEIFKPRFF